MNIFNSLGSNYDLWFVIKTLFLINIRKSKRLETLLDTKYNGKSVVLYKGREALFYALQVLNLPTDSAVAITGFTCFAVYEAVKKAELNVEYLDLEKNFLNFNADKLVLALKHNSNIKAVIVQNTLGYTCEIEMIAKICREKNIILIEDLAHCIGAKYSNGVEVGLVGDIAILSFSQDKMIDGVSGGAVIFRKSKYQQLNKQNFNKLGLGTQIRDKLYPFFTFVIRHSYGVILGKILHKLLKFLNLLSRPMNSNLGLYSLPEWYQDLIYTQFLRLDVNLENRYKIAKVYIEKLPQDVLIYKTKKDIESSNNLRFPIIIKNRQKILDYLTKLGIHLTDIWYDAPVSPLRFQKYTDYSNQCPEAEKMSKMILNLPTHKNITELQAEKISKYINLWLKSQ